MNGRCESDPFDQAIDVCPSCYGEFCSQCLVDTKVRKHPLCRECALIVSGLRVGGKPVVRGDKKTVKQRRAALRQKPVTRAFEYFGLEGEDDGSPTESNRSSSGQWLSSDDALGQAAQGQSGDEIGDAESADESGKLKRSAIDQLGVIKETGVTPPKAQRPAADDGDELPEHLAEAFDEADEGPAAFRRPRPFIGSTGGGPVQKSSPGSDLGAAAGPGQPQPSPPTWTDIDASTAPDPFAGDPFVPERSTPAPAADPFTPERSTPGPAADRLAPIRFTPSPAAADSGPAPSWTDPFAGHRRSDDRFAPAPPAGAGGGAAAAALPDHTAAPALSDDPFANPAPAANPTNTAPPQIAPAPAPAPVPASAPAPASVDHLAADPFAAPATRTHQPLGASVPAAATAGPSLAGNPFAADPFDAVHAGGVPHPGAPQAAAPQAGDPFAGDPFAADPAGAAPPAQHAVQSGPMPSPSPHGGPPWPGPSSDPNSDRRQEPAQSNSFDAAVFEADPGRSGALDEDLFDSEAHHDPFGAPAFDNPPSERRPIPAAPAGPGSPDLGSVVPGADTTPHDAAAPLPKRRGGPPAG